jgi:peptide/nickel transport system substrate-binding protein
VTRHHDSIEGLLGEYVERRIDRRQFFKRAAVLGVSLSSAGSLLAACGGDDEEAAPPPAETGVASTGPAPAPAETPSKPVVGGTLREGYDRDVTRADPVNTAWWDAQLYPVQHETLVARDPDSNFVPMLAESWEISADNLEWRFKIRDGLTFHSGAPCDAKAVSECFNAARDPAQGVNAGFWAPVKAVGVEEGNIVKVTMSQPYADFFFVIDNGYSAIFNKAERDKLKDNYGVTGTDGTGPFVLKEFVPGSHCLVGRWDDYPGSIVPFLENKGTAYLDEVRWIVLAEPATRAQELEAGNIDALHGPAPQDVERLKANDDLAVIEFEELGFYMMGLSFKRTDLGFDDVRVRQAISRAIDRQAIADTVFFGNAVPAYTISNSTWKFYEPGVAEFGAFDPEQSRTLLEQAGWAGASGVREKGGKKLSFEIIVEGDETEGLVVQAMQEMLADVGVDLKFKSYGADYFEQLFKEPTGFMFKQLWSNVFDASLLFADSRFSLPNCCNASFAKIPELDKAFLAWQSAANDEELAAAAKKAQLVAAEQLPFIPILTPLNVWVHHKRVHGWLPFAAAALYPFYNDVWIEA